MRSGAWPAVRSLLWVALLPALTACSHWPGFKPEKPAVELRLPAAPVAFRLEGRVAVKAGEESFSGGLLWQRDAGSEEVLLRTPLGQGVAELRGDSTGMELKDSEGKLHYAPDADTLAQRALGVELPLRGLAWWVVGLPRPGATYRAIPDADGHLAELVQDGWQILFSRYAPHAGRQLPGKLVARRGEELEVRVVVDTWRLP
jgi:outer membrane lipoprotein LolB